MSESISRSHENDLISRQAAISISVLPKEHREYQTMNLDDAYELGWYDLQKCIEKLPSAQPMNVQEAYYRGMLDGIKRCTEKLKSAIEVVANGRDKE